MIKFKELFKKPITYFVLGALVVATSVLCGVLPLIAKPKPRPAITAEQKEFLQAIAQTESAEPEVIDFSYDTTVLSQTQEISEVHYISQNLMVATITNSADDSSFIYLVETNGQTTTLTQIVSSTDYSFSSLNGNCLVITNRTDRTQALYGTSTHAFVQAAGVYNSITPLSDGYFLLSKSVETGNPDYDDYGYYKDIYIAKISGSSLTICATQANAFDCSFASNFVAINSVNKFSLYFLTEEGTTEEFTYDNNAQGQTIQELIEQGFEPLVQDFELQFINQNNYYLYLELFGTEAHHSHIFDYGDGIYYYNIANYLVDMSDCSVTLTQDQTNTYSYKTFPNDCYQQTITTPDGKTTTSYHSAEGKKVWSPSFEIIHSFGDTFIAQTQDGTALYDLNMHELFSFLPGSAIYCKGNLLVFEKNSYYYLANKNGKLIIDQPCDHISAEIDGKVLFGTYQIFLNDQSEQTKEWTLNLIDIQTLNVFEIDNINVDLSTLQNFQTFYVQNNGIEGLMVKSQEGSFTTNGLISKQSNNVAFATAEGVKILQMQSNVYRSSGNLQTDGSTSTSAKVTDVNDVSTLVGSNDGTCSIQIQLKGQQNYQSSSSHNIVGLDASNWESSYLFTTSSMELWGEIAFDISSSISDSSGYLLKSFTIYNHDTWICSVSNTSDVTKETFHLNGSDRTRYWVQSKYIEHSTQFNDTKPSILKGVYGYSTTTDAGEKPKEAYGIYVVRKSKQSASGTIIYLTFEPISVKINYKNNYDSTYSVSQKQNYGTKYNLPNNSDVKRDGYTFNGTWTYSSKTITSNSYVLEPSEHTLYPESTGWVPNQYTIKFNINDNIGKPIYKSNTRSWNAQDQTISANEKSTTQTFGQSYNLSSIPIPTCTAYDFIGWFDSNGTKIIGVTNGAYNSSTVGNWGPNGATATLYAHWTPKSYTITLETPNLTKYGGNNRYPGWGSASLPSTSTTISYTIEDESIDLSNFEPTIIKSGEPNRHYIFDHWELISTATGWGTARNGPTAMSEAPNVTSFGTPYAFNGTVLKTISGNKNAVEYNNSSGEATSQTSWQAGKHYGNVTLLAVFKIPIYYLESGQTEANITESTPIIGFRLSNESISWASGSKTISNLPGDLVAGCNQYFTLNFVADYSATTTTDDKHWTPYSPYDPEGKSSGPKNWSEVSKGSWNASYHNNTWTSINCHLSYTVGNNVLTIKPQQTSSSIGAYSIGNFDAPVYLTFNYNIVKYKTYSDTTTTSGADYGKINYTENKLLVPTESNRDSNVATYIKKILETSENDTYHYIIGSERITGGTIAFSKLGELNTSTNTYPNAVTTIKRIQITFSTSGASPEIPNETVDQGTLFSSTDAYNLWLNTDATSTTSIYDNTYFNHILLQLNENNNIEPTPVFKIGENYYSVSAQIGTSKINNSECFTEATTVKIQFSDYTTSEENAISIYTYNNDTGKTVALHKITNVTKLQIASSGDHGDILCLFINGSYPFPLPNVIVNEGKFSVCGLIITNSKLDDFADEIIISENIDKEITVFNGNYIYVVYQRTGDVPNP